MAAEYRVGRAWSALSRPVSFAVTAVAYALALAAALAVAAALDGHHHPLTITLAADLTATVVIFALSMVAGNSSLYDPYWSVAPAVIVLAWAARGFVSGRQVVVLVLVLIWAVRLTANWAVSWRGLGHEDWRYVQIRGETAGRLPWWLVSLTGIQLMPTLVVLVGMLPIWPAMNARGRGFGLLDGVAVAVTAAAVLLEAVADIQLRRFAADPAHHGEVADVGVWRHSRHPNYLGEIGFWCGMWLFGLAADPSWWWTVAGPAVMIGLFALVSVPLMDRRSLARRPGYAEYLRHVPALLPLPRRRSADR